MSALAIVLVCVGGVFGYCIAVVYLYMRVKWHMKQRDRYAMAEAAFFAALLLPVGVCLLVLYSRDGIDRDGLPPRAVRHERKIKQQRKEIDRLEEELGIR